MSAHGAHEGAAWNLAIGVAFVAAASVPRRAAGLIPLLATFAVVLGALSVHDLAAGTVSVARLATHAAVFVGLLVLAAARPGRAGPAARTVRFRPRPFAARRRRRRRRPHRSADRRMRRLARLLLVFAGLFGVGLLLASPASAHASVVTSDPADGSRLKAAPKTVSITFDEGVGLGKIGYLHITDQTGARVDTGDGTHPGGDQTKIRDTLRSGLGDGTYTASFRVISADSHPVTGTVRFVVGDGALVRGSVSASGGNG